MYCLIGIPITLRTCLSRTTTFWILNHLLGRLVWLEEGREGRGRREEEEGVGGGMMRKGNGG